MPARRHMTLSIVLGTLLVPVLGIQSAQGRLSQRRLRLQRHPSFLSGCLHLRGGKRGVSADDKKRTFVGEDGAEVSVLVRR